MQQNKGEQLYQEFLDSKGDRGTLESHWQEIAERVWPTMSNTFNSNNYNTPGEKKNDLVFDSTASIGLNRFAAILDSMLTPRNAIWHKLMPSDPYLNKDRQVKLWFEELNRILFKYRYAPIANFSSQNQINFKALGAFGTGGMFVDELDGGVGMRYKSIHLGELHFKENHQGIIDTAYRLFKMTARQAFQKWGDILPDSIKSQLATSPNKQFEFLHCVKPREDVDYERVDAKGMPFASYYVSITGKTLLSEGGYSTFPYSVSRYEQAPGEVYGRSPAMEVLPAIKTLNEEKKILLKQGHRTVDPVLLAHDDGVLDSFSLKPGAINYGGVSADGRSLVQALPVGNVMIGKDLMDDERLVINDAFLVTLFQILTETPTMTATEVMERTREKGILLAPTLGRQQSEYLGPMIEREVDILVRQGLIGPMPGALLEARGEYRIEYDSPLSRAQRAEEAAGAMRALETALNIANVTQDPSVLDPFDFDIMVPEMAEIQGMPTRWTKTKERIEEIRNARAQANQAQGQIEAAPAAAALMKARAATE